MKVEGAMFEMYKATATMLIVVLFMNGCSAARRVKSISWQDKSLPLALHFLIMGFAAVVVFLNLMSIAPGQKTDTPFPLSLSLGAVTLLMFSALTTLALGLLSWRPVPCLTGLLYVASAVTSSAAMAMGTARDYRAWSEWGEVAAIFQWASLILGLTWLVCFLTGRLDQQPKA